MTDKGDYSHLSPDMCPVVVVQWSDIASYENWNEAGRAFGSYDACTSGWLLDENEKDVVIASTYNHDDGTWGNIHVFPKRAPTVTRVEGGEA